MAASRSAWRGSRTRRNRDRDFLRKSRGAPGQRPVIGRHSTLSCRCHRPRLPALASHLCLLRHKALARAKSTGLIRRISLSAPDTCPHGSLDKAKHHRRRNAVFVLFFFHYGWRDFSFLIAFRTDVNWPARIPRTNVITALEFQFRTATFWVLRVPLHRRRGSNIVDTTQIQ